MLEWSAMKKNLKKNTHTLIISDFHLGSTVSRSQELAMLLKNFKFKKLILLGDIFESLNFDSLREQDWELLSLISKFSKTRKVIWVEGNHDKGIVDLFAVFTGAKAYKVYKWQFRNKKYIAIHGHQFDNFLINNALISFLATKIYNCIQIIDFRDKRISRFLKRKSKGWLRLSKKVANRAIRYAKFRNADYIFCGHTHKSKKVRRGKTMYYNSGCWTDIPSAYITIDKDNIKIHKYY